MAPWRPSVAQTPAVAPASTPAADSAAADSTPSTPYVLHVYANLVQIPTLALSSTFKPLPPLTPNKIFISLDSGPAFHPTKMHVEGEEPISLGILLDASGNQDRLLPSFAKAVAKMTETSLRPHDHVSVFAADCRIVRSSLDMPALSVSVQTAVNNALNWPTLHEGKKRGACGNSLHLWDASIIAAKALSDQPGRKVLILVTSGEDRKSITSWKTLQLYADDHSIAIFGLRDLIRFAGDFSLHALPGEAGVYYGGKDSVEDHYTDLCQSTGGLIFTTPENELTASLERVIAMVRGRYIIEFPRSDESTPGRHSIDITIPSESTFITTAGVTVDLPDADREKDPTTIHGTPSPAVMGKRRALPPTN